MHQTSCPYTPQQNGVAERKNRHLMEVARSMMFNTNVPRRFWSDDVTTACYLINRIPTTILNDSSPFEVLNQTIPSIDHLRVFGCVCFVLRPGALRDKLEAKSTKCMFLGYSTTQKGYKCYDFSRNRMIVSRDVKFIEHQGYHDKKNWGSLKDLVRSPSDRVASLQHLLSHIGNPPPRREEQSENVETYQQGVETTEDQPNPC
ncbi:Retrovirus-related Pol polyprotein from transposon RE1 [Cardamine amara subsp. amara]|uniref:Retrovirus-related Pol polyprotein from transposon RE1 n=1 Tax=Cardamine amara subsp. amara TaxID=228776 RepID=A0ABD1C5W8_CARAN